MNTLKAIVESKPDSISIHMPQALLWLRELGYSGAIEADTGLNIFNGSALQVWQAFNMSKYSSILRVDLGTISKLTKSAHLPLEVMVHGYQK